MLNGIEAACAAGEILTLVREIKEKYRNMPEVLEDLIRIENKAQEIKSSGESGWY